MRTSEPDPPCGRTSGISASCDAHRTQLLSIGPSSNTPDWAWAELLRHEAITDPADLAGVDRALWAVEPPDVPDARPDLHEADLLGGPDRYPACRTEATRLRRARVRGFLAPSAALLPGPSGHRVDSGLLAGPDRAGQVAVLFGPRPDLVGWAACAVGRPRLDLLPRVRFFVHLGDEDC